MKRIHPSLLALALLLTTSAAQAAPKLDFVRVDARVVGQELSDAGLDFQLELQEQCTAKLNKEPTPLPCGDWRPLPSLGEARKLVFKGDLEINGKTKNLVLRGNHEGGEVFAARARLGTADWVELVPAEEGRWRLPPGAVGAWALRGDDDWAVDLQVRVTDAALDAVEGVPVAVPTAEWSRFATGWSCDALAWLGDSWSAGGVRPSALASADASTCPDAGEAARAASCEAIDKVGHTLAQSGDLAQLTDLVADGDALAASCPGALTELTASGSLAREFLVTTQQREGLVSLARTWGPLLGAEWAAATRKAGADASMQDARRTGETAPLLAFLEAFPEHAESDPVARALLEISAALELPCGQKRGCPELPAGSALAATWIDVPDRPAAARLVAWSRAGGGQSVADALTAWADGTPPEEVEAAAAALLGESEAGRWALTLPFSLKRITDDLEGYALELRVDGLEPVFVPLRVEAALGPFAGRSRAVLLRADGASRIDEPGTDPVPLASLPIHPSNHTLHGRHLYVWSSWDPVDGPIGPSPAALLRVDLDVGGLETVLEGEPIAAALSTPEGLRLRIGAGCSLAAAVSAGRSTPADLNSHPGGKTGPPPAECRGALVTDEGLVDAPAELPASPPPAERPSPAGLALVTDQVAGTPELFVVEQATGRRLQVSKSHALGKDHSVPSGCEDGSAFLWRWHEDGRLLVHHGLAMCGEVARGPLLLVQPADGASVVLSGSTDGLPAWLDRSWAADREATLAADGTIAVGEDLHAGSPGVHSAWWYRPRLVDLLR